MHDVEIEKLILHLPGVARERAESIGQQVGERLREQLTPAKTLMSGHVENLRIRLDLGSYHNEKALVQRLANAISSEIQGG